MCGSFSHRAGHTTMDQDQLCDHCGKETNDHMLIQLAGQLLQGGTMSHKCYSISFKAKSCSSHGISKFPSIASGWLSYKRHLE